MCPLGTVRSTPVLAPREPMMAYSPDRGATSPGLYCFDMTTFFPMAWVDEMLLSELNAGS